MSSGTSTATIVEATFATLQDEGRPSGASWGIAANGALDQFSYHYGNALVGNQVSVPSLETVMTDLAVAFSDEVIVAVTGASAEVTVGGLPARMNQALVVPAGGELAVRDIRDGVRCYVSIFGGFGELGGGRAFLGSVAPDRTLRYGLDLVAGLTLGCGPAGRLDVSGREYPFPVLSPPRPQSPAAGELGVLPGENRDLFERDADDIFDGDYVMTDKTDAVGSRLEGRIPRRRDTAEILSRALPIGSIEVPGGKELLVLNRGRGLSAGYPVVGVICTSSMNVLSQTRPGAAIRFVPITVAAARRLRSREAEIIQSARERMTRILDTPRVAGAATNDHKAGKR
ncbi:allophanate hydrolase [Prauserella marina]|uniref:Allophanate hydrolase subunit 2 n=1 Tax=Prauserella marina TaxID=530584 RepID=A0A222VP94_9PSEU|nr:allophanate hydrolase [Prauserella marina]ASR35739.1 allophanate hydrolase [Prauserella marina]PWV84374.1 allophanate hydrolase subunit 2 [Prauserella marina]SDC24173.1 Allophanate hydrolase subunit 2 [Prauserella marina]